MPLPLALMGLAGRSVIPRLLGSRAGLIGMSGGAGALGSLFGSGGGNGSSMTGRRRRRRARTLTKGQLGDLTFIAHHIGKTAAGEYLHFIR